MKKFLLLLALLVPAYAEAVTRYISPTGSNDGNSCAASTSSSTPKQTFHDTSGTNGAVRCMSGGDTLVIMGGTYTRFIDRDSTPNIPNGTAGAPTTFRVQTGATVNVTSTYLDYGAIEFLNGGNRSYITIDGSVNCGVNSSGSCALIMDGTGSSSNTLINVGHFNDHINITNFEAKNNVNNGIGFAGTFNTLSNCNIHHHGGPGGPSSAYGVYQGGGEDTLIENCLVHHNGGYGIHLNANSNAAGSSDVPDHLVKRATFRYNDIYANGIYATIESAGLLLGGFSEDVEAYSNLVHDNVNNTGGIQFNYFRTVKRAKVYNNTVTRNSRFGIQVYNAEDSTLINNLVGDNNLANSGFLNIDNFYAGSGNSYTTNGCFGTGGAASPCNSTVTPNFVNAAGGNFQLQAGSPGLNVGTDLASPYNRDMFNTLRPPGAFDLGAFERSVFVPGPVTDNFDRTNGALGANWSGSYTGQTNGTIVTNKVRGTTLNSNMVQVYAAPIGLIQAPTVTLATVGAGLSGDGALLLRASATPTATFYYIAASTGTPSTTYIYRCVTGSCTTNAQDASQTWASGDVLKATISDTSGLITVYKNDVAFMTYTDPSPLTGTRTGIGSFSANALGDIELDDFYVGGTPIPDIVGRVIKVQAGQTLKLGQQ